ncbi:unnamed protein product [Periconia digitata]|uniref:Uncharacterized protein n=1 Tax=Periconia digitata TaxID=1303443 RepID=A0A9W4UCY8_9PLEO|nr:unnamed protein product [Periconia digitata]
MVCMHAAICRCTAINRPPPPPCRSSLSLSWLPPAGRVDGGAADAQSGLLHLSPGHVPCSVQTSVHEHRKQPTFMIAAHVTSCRRRKESHQRQSVPGLADEPGPSLFICAMSVYSIVPSSIHPGSDWTFQCVTRANS